MKILALTTDAALEVALVSIERSWKIYSARTFEAAASQAAGVDVALVSLGTTERGMAAAERIHELGLGLRCLVVGDVSPPDGSDVAVLRRPFSMNDLMLAISEQAARQVAGSHPAPSPVIEAVANDTVAREPEAPTEDERVPVEWAASLLAELGHTEADPPAPPPPKLLPVEAAPEREASAAIIMRRALADPEARGHEGGGLHRLRRRRLIEPRAHAPARGAMTRRVQTALEAATDLESLLRELPSLSCAADLAMLFVGETREVLGAETVSIFVAETTGWHLLASHGLSTTERGMVVSDSQPLFRDVSARVEAVLVSPVDLVRGIVAGIPGSGPDSLMLAPLEAQGSSYGVVTAGRDSFESADLERFWALAEEVAPALAAARLLGRLRSLMAPAS